MRVEPLQRVAGESGHQPAAIEKVLRLLDLLQAIAGDDFLKTRLALKGGTALNLFYFQLGRLSVDIDLNYVGAPEREAMLAERPQVEASLGRLLAGAGYDIRRQPDDHAGGKWIAQHLSALGGRGVLELDVNFMMREPLFGAGRIDAAAFDADPKELRNNLLFCLPRNRFPDRRAIDAWIEETVAICRQRLAPILDWTAAERAFLDGVIDDGVIDAARLEIDPEIAARIDRMPMLEWKARHVQQLKQGR